MRERAATPRASGFVVADWLALSKPRLSALVALTCATGLWIAPGSVSLSRAFAVLVSATLLIAGANTLNSYMERNLDRRMVRTQNRPLATERLSATLALCWGLFTSASGLWGLGFFSHALTAFWGAIAWTTYVFLYTPLKRHSPLALPVGAVAGAIPPLLGWTAVTGHVGWAALALPALVFFWQIPHFIAISIYLQPDYKSARILTVTAVYGERISRVLVAASSGVLLLATPLVAHPLLSTWATVAATTLALALFGLSVLGQRPRSAPRWAHAFFVATLAYLPVLLLLFVVGVRG